MNFVAKLLQGISFVPTIVQGVEGLLGSNNGATKKSAALAIVQTAISATDALTNNQIVDGDKFQGGLGKVVDGVVDCLNASIWAKNPKTV